MDPRVIDVDFPLCPEYVFGDLGCRALDPTVCREFGDAIETIPESDWRELCELIERDNLGLDSLVTRIYNQRSEGSCVANACAQSLEIIQAKQRGEHNVVHLSAISLYKRIGRSPSSGAMISDGLEEMRDRGILPLDNPENQSRFPHCMPNTGWSTPFPRGWMDTAKLFKATEWFILRGVDELVSALLRGHPVVVGRAGHSICYCRPAYRNGRFLVRYANSWSGNWGEGGFGWDSSNLIRSSASWAFCVRAAVDPTREG